MQTILQAEAETDVRSPGVGGRWANHKAIVAAAAAVLVYVVVVGYGGLMVSTYTLSILSPVSSLTDIYKLECGNGCVAVYNCALRWIFLSLFVLYFHILLLFCFDFSKYACLLHTWGWIPP